MFTAVPYMGPAPRGRWPVPSSDFSGEVAERSMHLSLEQFELADQLGFDWVTVAEHHFAPMSLTPNPIYMAGSSPESSEFAARNHLSLGFAFTTVPLASKAARYGRDMENQRDRLAPHALKERIELGQLLVGSPETVLNQICTIRESLGCGILDLIFQPVGRDKTLKAIELFGEHVLPRVHAL